MKGLLRDIEVYEIPNTYTTDISFERQIDLGICNWKAEVTDSSVYGGYKMAFGQTKAEALENLRGML